LTVPSAAFNMNGAWKVVVICISTFTTDIDEYCFYLCVQFAQECWWSKIFLNIFALV